MERPRSIASTPMPVKVCQGPKATLLISWFDSDDKLVPEPEPTPVLLRLTTAAPTAIAAGLSLFLLLR